MHSLHRHRAKIAFLTRLAVGAHVVLIQESRGTAEDLIQLHDLLPGWRTFGSFAPHVTSGGVLILLSPELCHHYPEQHFVQVVTGRIALVRLRSRTGPSIDVVNIHPFASPGQSRIQPVDRLTTHLTNMAFACTVLAGDLNCCAPGEGRYDIDAGRIHLDLSAETEVFGERLADFHEVVAAGYSRVQLRAGVPKLLLRIDRVLVNFPVQELMGGGVRARYTIPVDDRHLPSDHSPRELVIYPPTARRRPTIPRWAASHLVFRMRIAEASTAILESGLDPFASLAEIARSAFAILPEVSRS